MKLLYNANRINPLIRNFFSPFKSIHCLLVLAALSFLSIDACAQFSPKIKDGLKTYLTADSSCYLKFNFVGQVWLRANQSNPGSTVNGQLVNTTYDVGIRRVRFVMSGQLTDRVFIFVQFGQNNFNYLSPRKTGAFFHDVALEYAVVKKKFSLGFGLQGWNGLGRYSNSSVSTILALDPPIFQETTNDITDQFVRRLGIYAKGKLGKLDYRVSASNPFVTQTASTSFEGLSTNSSYSTLYPNLALQGYFMYQFLDQESNLGPGTVGTYLGKKRVFNIGAGFVQQSKAMWSKTATNDTTFHNMNLLGLDVFYDSPVDKAKGTSVTVYSGLFRYDFGKGYIRNVGPMNPANGTNAKGSFNGPGNAIPLIGTGNVFYMQSGYKLKNDLFGAEFGTLQFYAGYQYAKYDRLNDPVAVIDAGVHWLVSGHNSKFTFNYQNRPIFNTVANEIKVTDHKGEFVLQYQVAF